MHVQVLCPRTEVVEMDAPHFVLQAKPAESAEAVGRFLQQIGERR